MTALLWKDLRVNRLVIVFGAIMLAVPYLTMIVRGLYLLYRYGDTTWWDAGTLGIASAWSIALSMLTIAMIAGNVVAAERQDHSAEFLAYLPPTRSQIVLSKLTVALGVGGALWAVNLVALLVIAPLLPGDRDLPFLRGGGSSEFMLFLAACACMFGVAWLCSTISSSPAISVGAGIFAPAILAGLIQAYAYFLIHADGLPDTAFPFERVFRIACVIVGATATAGGLWYYTHRVEP